MNKIYLLIICMLIFMSNVLSQVESSKGIGIQVKYSFANTFHYNAPVAIVSYHEGTNYFKQYPRTKSQYEFALLKSLSKNQDIKIGIGLSSYSFYQEREDVYVIGLPVYPITKETFDYQFVSYMLGIRHKLKSEVKLKPFMDFELQYDKNIIEDFSVKQGIALKYAIGLLVQLNERTSITTNGFYKSAITSYNWQNTYFPFQWGIEFGFIYQ